MKQVTLWEARDGSRHDNELACARREELLNLCDNAEAPLGKKPNDPSLDFANGHGYVLHAQRAIQECRTRINKVALNAGFAASRGDIALYHISHIARWADDDCRPLAKLAARFMCIDEVGREWGQQYYALHPSEGKGDCIEDRQGVPL